MRRMAARRNWFGSGRSEPVNPQVDRRCRLESAQERERPKHTQLFYQLVLTPLPGFQQPQPKPGVDFQDTFEDTVKPSCERGRISRSSGSCRRNDFKDQVGPPPRPHRRRLPLCAGGSGHNHICGTETFFRPSNPIASPDATCPSSESGAVACRSASDSERSSSSLQVAVWHSLRAASPPRPRCPRRWNWSGGFVKPA